MDSNRERYWASTVVDLSLAVGVVGAMDECNSKISLQKKRRMRNNRKRRKRQERAISKRLAVEDALAQKIKDSNAEQKSLAEKYYSKWKRISKEAIELRRKIPAKMCIRKVSVVNIFLRNSIYIY